MGTGAGNASSKGPRFGRRMLGGLTGALGLTALPFVGPKEGAGMAVAATKKSDITSVRDATRPPIGHPIQSTCHGYDTRSRVRA